MKNDERHLAANLRFLCGLERSISAAAANIGINRQQFNKYLAGKTNPSISTLRKISDYFSVDEGELFLPPGEFSSLFQSKGPSKLPSELTEILEGMASMTKRIVYDLKGLDGVFRCFQRAYGSEEIHLSVVRIAAHSGGFITSRMSRRSADAPSSNKAIMDRHDGVIYFTAGRLLWGEAHRNWRQNASLSSTVLHGAPGDHSGFVLGFGSGIGPDLDRRMQGVATVLAKVPSRSVQPSFLRNCAQVSECLQDLPSDARSHLGLK